MVESLSCLTCSDSHAVNKILILIGFNLHFYEAAVRERAIDMQCLKFYDKNNFEALAR